MRARPAVAVVASHPVQNHSPWFRGLAAECMLEVLYAHRPSAHEQGTGYGVDFEWDVDLTSGHPHRWLANHARRPSVQHFFGCDTPDVGLLLAAGRFDACIVLGWNLATYWQAVRACATAGIPVIARGDSRLGPGRSRPLRLAKHLAYPGMLRRFRAFLSPGERHAAYLRHYGVPSARIHFVPHVVDVDRLRAQAREGAARRASIRAKLGVGADERVALFVGRFLEVKRPFDLVDAVARRARTSAKWRAVYVGAGPLADAIAARARTRDAPVVLAGFKNQSEIAAMYAAADALVLSSDGRETWGLVVNEAMACGLPVVVSDAAGCAPDLVDDGETGVRYPCGDVAALADALDRTVAFAGSDRARAAIERKLDRYGLQQAVRGTLEAVESVRVET